MTDTLVRGAFAFGSAAAAIELMMKNASQPSCNNGHAGFAFHFETVLIVVELCGMAAPLVGLKSRHLRVSYRIAFASVNKIVKAQPPRVRRRVYQVSDGLWLCTIHCSCLIRESRR